MSFVIDKDEFDGFKIEIYGEKICNNDKLLCIHIKIKHKQFEVVNLPVVIRLEKEDEKG